MGDHLVMETPERVSAREVIERRAEARRAERAAREALTRFIVSEYEAGARPVDIARSLSGLADQMDLSAAERRRFGVSESSVHLTLKIAGVK